MVQMIRALATALIAISVGAGAAQARVLTVATFNAEFLIREKVHARDGLPLVLSPAQQAEWTPQRREQAFASAVALVAPVVANINADVIVLTEVGPAADVASLNAALASPYPHVAVCQCTDSATGQHVAILSRLPLTNIASAIPGREHFLTELDDDETEQDTGISKGMSARISFNGQPIVIYAVHLVSERGGHEDDAQRIAQASIVRRNYLRDITERRHVIVAGDLNEKRGDPTLVRIRGLDDIQPDLIQTGNAGYFAADQLDERWTYEFQGERNQIDHILLSDSIRDAAKRGGIRSTVTRVSSSQISDHSPLIVRIDFKE